MIEFIGEIIRCDECAFADVPIDSGIGVALAKESLKNVIPAQAGIPFPRPWGKVGWGRQSSWAPAFAGATN